MTLSPLWKLRLGPAIGQCRAAPVRLGPGRPAAFLVAWGADFDVDPYIEMFFFPEDTLKLAVVTVEGEILWQRDLGPGLVPGMWFCPIYPFDLDGDGIDELYLVNNTETPHPLSAHGRVLQALDARTGGLLGQWPWTLRGNLRMQPPELMFRNFIAGGRVDGRPVLVAAQGTYGDLHLAGFDPGMKPRWETFIPAAAPGARGSHGCPVLDLDGNGRDSILYGERAIDLADGRERFCADRDSYRGHSDVVAPVWLEPEKTWLIFTCRESDPDAAPRICAYDAAGRRLWGRLDRGHIDMGWPARIAPGRRPVVNGIRIDGKTCGPDGRFHKNPEAFTYDARDGGPVALPFYAYGTLPVDLDGDGLHEFVRGRPGGDGAVFDGSGRLLGTAAGGCALACHLGPWPGEQLLMYSNDGHIALWCDLGAADTPAALARYAHPFYASAARSTAVGYQLFLLGGL